MTALKKKLWSPIINQSNVKGQNKKNHTKQSTMRKITQNQIINQSNVKGQKKKINFKKRSRVIIKKNPKKK